MNLCKHVKKYLLNAKFKISISFYQIELIHLKADNMPFIIHCFKYNKFRE